MKSELPKPNLNITGAELDVIFSGVRANVEHSLCLFLIDMCVERHNITAIFDTLISVTKVSLSH